MRRWFSAAAEVLLVVASWVLAVVADSTAAYVLAGLWTVRILVFEQLSRRLDLPKWTADEGYATKLRRWSKARQRRRA